MPEKTAASVALVQLLSEVGQLRSVVDMIALTASVCVVQPRGVEVPPIPRSRVRDVPGPGAPVREIVVVAARSRREYAVGDDDWGSLDPWDEEITEPPGPDFCARTASRD